MNTTDGSDANADADLALVAAARRVAEEYARPDLHTVAAAARTGDGGIVTAVNVYHFTGGPCAELVVIGAAAGQGAYELTAMVAVRSRDMAVIPPCGRCRQVLIDYFPGIDVLVQPEGRRLTRLPVAELLPAAFSRSAPEQP
ncbi:MULTISPECIES: cytidine deaminase family protein [Streptomyces]|uniref:Cytidine deaminase n=1 Tax=Streptomyces murinus TaxID=33900 RepID=A0A7W3NN86_STRMR|nr:MULTISPECIES: cytidine deaminase [Streptomyces]MBA9053673.1 cytidine deaminase [Streptomyces murinus]UWW94776.1 cytidine deaminase [Streptomyces murinus]WSI85529.1 cytidine deaminase [Streptomyces murinus]